MKIKLPLLLLGITFFSFFKMRDKEKMVWSDEFNYTGFPDSSKWNYDLGNGCPDNCGWGNHELQTYTKALKNARVKDGILTIEAHAQDSNNYSSARMVSVNDGSWKYGKIVIRAKLPKGVGTWPAIWMLPTDWEYGEWPNSGEIDIMEHVGYDQGKIHGTVHTESFNHTVGTQKGNFIELKDVSDQFHVYSIEWNKKAISFFVDEVRYNYFENTSEGYKEWPFDKPFYIIMNIAVGGDWGGEEGVDNTIWPQRMEIDYVRVYKK
jgi:beta-glucanase (GH16 family)